MQRLAFKMKLFPGRAKEYQDRHNAIWPELVTLLKESGISDYSIYLDEETDILFATYLFIDEAALLSLPASPVMQRWWQYMGDIMESNPDNSPVSSVLNPLFYLA